jgi:hypothetical protein
MHKTGTTSLQTALAKYDDGTTFYAQLEHDNHSIPIHTAFSENFLIYDHWVKRGYSEKEIKTKRIAYRRRLEEQLSRKARKNVIISGEDISLLSRAAVIDLINLVKRYCDDTHIIAYLRDPSGYASSALQQRISIGLSSLPKTVSPEYRLRLEKFIECVGKENVIVKPYDPNLLLEGDVVKDFCSIFDLDHHRVNPIRTNKSNNANTIKAIYVLNRTNPLSFGDEKLLQARHEFVKIVSRIYAGGAQLDIALLESLTDYNDCRWLKKEFNLDYLPKMRHWKRRIISSWLQSNAARLLRPFGKGRRANADPQTINDWLDCFDQNFKNRLISFLKANGVEQEFEHDPVRLINRIYYFAIEGKKIPPQGLKLANGDSG